jgi:glutathione synthase/RimK-type ligase-like ATP-grasp enzyme
MKHVKILVPDADEALFGPMWPALFARLAAPLEREGLKATSQAWTQVEADADLILPLLAWGYHHDAALWYAQVAALEAAGARVLNPFDVLRWNADKAYLERLGADGAPTVPSIAVERLTPEVLDHARAAFGAERLVVKPRISGGGHRTVRIEPGQEIDAEAPQGPALIQPYLPAVETEGELSLFYFDRRFSHAVAKVAKAGDFRVQHQFGGSSTAIDPEPAARRAAEAVLAKVKGTLLYARVDLIRGREGEWALMELELIEPDLFLQYAADGGAAYGAAVRAAAG